MKLIALKHVNQQAVILSDSVKNREDNKHIKIHTLYIVIPPENKDTLMALFHKRNITNFMNLKYRFFCDVLSPQTTV